MLIITCKYAIYVNCNIKNSDDHRKYIKQRAYNGDRHRNTNAKIEGMEKTSGWHSMMHLSNYRIHHVSVQLESMIPEDRMMYVDADELCSLLWQID